MMQEFQPAYRQDAQTDRIWLLGIIVVLAMFALVIIFTLTL
ncbi:MAG: hypothetical protein ACYDBB_18685 [Armatimonadota bacterium]